MTYSNKMKYHMAQLGMSKLLEHLRYANVTSMSRPKERLRDAFKKKKVHIKGKAPF